MRATCLWHRVCTRHVNGVLASFWMMLKLDPSTRWAVCIRALLACACLLVALPSWCQPVVRLDSSQPYLDLQQASLALIDPTGTLNITQVADGMPPLRASGSQPAMTPSGANTVYSLGEKGALWQHYRFETPQKGDTHWVLEFPLSLLDKVTVFQRNALGDWQEESAGDTLPVSSWPAPARYPYFRLLSHANATPEAVRDVYVRLQHVTPVTIPVNVVTEPLQARRLQLRLLLLGVVFGVMGFLIINGAVQSAVYRDAAYGWYAAYAAIMLAVLLAWTGVGGQLIWPDAARWNDLATGCLALLSTSTWPMVVHHLCRHPSLHLWQRALNKLASFATVAGVPMAVAYLFMPRLLGVLMLGAELILVSLLTMASALQTFRRRDVASGWVLVAVTPLTAATLFTASSLMGVLPTSWLAQNAITLALTLQVPLLWMALHVRSRERHEVEMRAQTMDSQDALTGLLARPIFDDRLNQTVLRAQKREETAAIVFIELANHAYVKKTWGVAVAEQSVLRSVIKLRRLLRDVNTVGRLDEARFGVILEGVSSREVVNDLASRLIASGLMPLKGLKPEVVLQFHVSSALLREQAHVTPDPGPALAQRLSDLLRSMSSRTRRPIRFLKSTDSGFGTTGLPDASNEAAWAITDGNAAGPRPHNTEAASPNS